MSAPVQASKCVCLDLSPSGSGEGPGRLQHHAGAAAGADGGKDHALARRQQVRGAGHCEVVGVNPGLDGRVWAEAVFIFNKPDPPER